MSAVGRVALVRMIRLLVSRFALIPQHVILEYPKRHRQMALGEKADRVEDIVSIELNARVSWPQDFGCATGRV